MRIYLLGFMASGKTSIGKRVAKQLNYEFIDLDDYLEEKNGKSITGIFKEDGEDVFRKLEKEALHDTFKMENIVIAAGGGTPCFFDNIEQINKNGISLYLKRSVDFFVTKLLTSKTVRPLVLGKSKKELKKYIQKTLDYRKQFYEQATKVYKVKDLTKDEMAEKIVKKIKKMNNETIIKK